MIGGRSSIVGIAQIPPFRHHDNTSGLELAGDAFMAALADAGLQKDQIDGLVIQHGQVAGPDYDEFAQFMDLDVSWTFQTWPHGRFTGTAITMATMMVEAGVVSYVACVNGYHRAGNAYAGAGGNASSEEYRPGGGPHGEQPWVGLTAPVAQAAMAAQTYSDSYGVNLEDLYDVVAAERAGAAKNPVAMRRRHLSKTEYLEDPLIVEPLRRADIAPVSEGGACVIVGARAAAGASPHPPVDVLGVQGLPAGRAEFMWSRPGLGLWMQGRTKESAAADERVYASSGIPRDRVRLLYTYDAFSPLVWFSLERFGFCGAGQAPEFIRDTGITLDGGLPVNTSGGMLCEGSRAGWGHIVEIVRQLRGDAGERQVAGADIAQWGPCFGESLIFGAR